MHNSDIREAIHLATLKMLSRADEMGDGPYYRAVFAWLKINRPNNLINWVVNCDLHLTGITRMKATFEESFPHKKRQMAYYDFAAGWCAKLEERVADLSQKLEAQEAESQYTRDRLLAVGVVAAHAAMTKDRVAALEEENRALKDRLAALEMIILGKKQE